MLDRRMTAVIKPAIDALASLLLRWRIGADQLTVAGFAIGLVAALCIANGAYVAGLVAILISRLCDALDGAVARQSQPTDQGGFMDIAFDFLFYAAIPLAFAWAHPSANALAAAFLLASFIGTGSSFLAFAALAAKRGMTSLAYPDKSFYFLGGLTEATETIAIFIAMCLWPEYFSVMAFGFALLCLLTTGTRIWWGWHALRDPDAAADRISP